MRTLVCPVCRGSIDVWKDYEVFERLLVFHTLSCNGSMIHYNPDCEYCTKGKCVFWRENIDDVLPEKVNLIRCSGCVLYVRAKNWDRMEACPLPLPSDL